MSNSVQLALTGGLSPGAKMKRDRCVTLTPTGVEFAGEMSAWNSGKRGCRFLGWMDTAHTLWLADFMCQGELLFGRDFVTETMAKIGFEKPAALRAAAVCSAGAYGTCGGADFPEHYWVLSAAKLEPQEQIRWALAGKDHGLTPQLLAESIAQGRDCDARGACDFDGPLERGLRRRMRSGRRLTYGGSRFRRASRYRSGIWIGNGSCWMNCGRWQRW